MQTRNKVFDDLSQLMTNAMGVAQGARAEAETALKSLVDRWLADRDFVTREEFDAVRAMAQKAREENETLKARLDAHEKLQAVVCLGRIAHESVLRALDVRLKDAPFAHGARHRLGDINLYDSYHCSRYNTNTGRLTVAMFEAVFVAVREELV